MPFTVVRFDLVDPRAAPEPLAERYRAAPEMAAYADGHGVATVRTEEHHGVEDNRLPSPFVFAGAVFGATRRIAVTVSAVTGPLHGPLRLAEEIAVLDLIGRGRLVTPGECAGPGLEGLVPRPPPYALGAWGDPGAGMPVEEGRRSLRLFCDEVLPLLGA